MSKHKGGSAGRLSGTSADAVESILLIALEIILFISAAIFLLALAGAIYQTVGTAVDRRKFPPPGRLVDVGGRRWHVIESGQGGPAVILEAGIGASCLNWTQVQSQVAGFTCVCSYDRASLGWSDPTGTPRTTLRLIEELHSLLAAAQIPAPYILVGHSFGGLLMRAYAGRYPDQVAGLVLVDPLRSGEWQQPSEAQRKTLRRGVSLARRGAMLARLGVVRFSLALLSGGARAIPKLVARVSSGAGESAISRLVGEVRKMPRETWPMVQSHWCQPKSFEGMGDYLQSLPASSSEAAALGDHPSLPVVILSAANSTPVQLAEREEVARRSPRGEHIATKSGHWIHLDDPDLVTQSIRELVNLAR